MEKPTTKTIDELINGDQKDRILAAGSTELSAQLQEQLSDDPDWEVRGRLALNTTISSDIQVKFVSDQNEQVVGFLVQSSKLSLEAQQQFLKSKIDNKWLMSMLANNKSVKNPEIQRKLIEMNDLRIKSNIAANSSLTDIELQKELIKDGYREPRLHRALAGNIGVTDKKIQEELLASKQDEISRTMSITINKQREQDKTSMMKTMREKILADNNEKEKK